MPEGSRCPHCGAHVRRRGRCGPWPTYCSVRCRRAVEYERDRLRRRLRRVESRRDAWIDADRQSNGFCSAAPFIDGSTFHQLVGGLHREALALRRRLAALHPDAAACGRKELFP